MRIWFNDIVYSCYLNVGNIVCEMVNCKNTVTMIRSTPLVLERFIVLYLFEGSVHKCFFRINIIERTYHRYLGTGCLGLHFGIRRKVF